LKKILLQNKINKAKVLLKGPTDFGTHLNVCLHFICLFGRQDKTIKFCQSRSRINITCEREGTDGLVESFEKR